VQKMMMMTATRIESVWQSIRKEEKITTLGDGHFHLQRLDPESRFNIYAGLDSAGNVLIALDVDTRPPDINLKTGALDYFRQQRTGGSWLMALRLVGENLDHVFGRLCQDLIDATDSVTTQTSLIKLFRERLFLWKKLFQQANDGCLEKYEIKGLFAELLALENFIKERPEAIEETVLAWRGPQGADQDFIFADSAVEVKAVSPSSVKVGISSIGQLNSRVPMQLWIYALKESTPAEKDCICIMNLATQVESLLSVSPRGLATFKKRLLEAGFFEHECYESACFTIMGLSKYTVSDTFPRLINNDIPKAVSDITYSISIPAISPFKI